MVAKQADPLWLESLARTHRRLAERAVTGPACPAAVLNLGTAVMFHGVLEQGWLFSLNPLLDRAAIAQLSAEHERLAEDLDLLESLWTADPHSPDLAPLARALRARLQEHVARDERVLYQPHVRQGAGRPDPDR